LKFKNGSFIGIHRIHAIHEFGEACLRPQLNVRLRPQTPKKLAGGSASAHLWTS